MARKQEESIQRSPKSVGNYSTILNIRISSSSASSVLKVVESWIREKRRFLVVTPNPEIVVMAQSDPVLSSILNSADLSLPDGVGLIWASRWYAWVDLVSSRFLKRKRPAVASGDLGYARPSDSSRSEIAHNQASPQVFLNHKSLIINHRLSGIDIMEALVKLAAKYGWRVFLLGSRPGIVQQAAKKLILNHKSLIINRDPGPWLNDDGKPINRVEEKKEKEVIKKINDFKPHLLFVAFGAPKQEKWVASNYNKLQTLGTMVVGGAFDYLSGRVPRAPLWMRNFGLEWLFRLFVEPWRIKRQFTLLRFAWLVITK